MRYTYLLLFNLLIVPFLVTAQSDSLNYNFHPPLGIPLVLSSNFGELRANHFHMGLDFKTNMKTGYKLYAIEDGWVSRVKVSTTGYGKVIYIDHPNGLTSVYAHCSEFKGSIDSLVRATQILEQNFVVEIFPEKNQLKVKRGEVIALSGNTGSSSGPHLHFEIRDTETEHALNPLKYGFQMADSKAPEIKGLRLYAVDSKGYRFESRMVSTPVIPSLNGNGYSIKNNELSITSDFCSTQGGIGLAFDVIDRFDGAMNQCGLYGSYLVVDGDTIFGQQIDRIPFENTRLVSTHKDYEAFRTLRKDFHKSFRTAINDLPIYKHEVNQGIIPVEPGKSYTIEYVAFDVSGNVSRLAFAIHVSVGPINNRESVSDGIHYLEPDQSYHFENEDCHLYLPEKAVFEPQYYDEDRFCGEVFDSHEPVNEPYRIKLINTYPEDGKSYIEVKGSTFNGQYLKTQLEGEWLTAESRYFGTYTVRRDEESPRILPINILSKTNFVSSKKLLWNISDTGSGLADYDLFINNEWHLVEFESKGNLLTFEIPEKLKGINELKLIVKDNCGNIQEWSKTIEFL
jgi:hypothetical protein